MLPVEREILRVRCLDYSLLLENMAHSEPCYLPPGPTSQVQGQAVSHLAHISPVTGGWTDEAVQVIRSVLFCTEVFSALLSNTPPCAGTSWAGFFTRQDFKISGKLQKNRRKMRENLRMIKIHQISVIHGIFTGAPGYSIFLKILLC